MTSHFDVKKDPQRHDTLGVSPRLHGRICAVNIALDGHSSKYPEPSWDEWSGNIIFDLGLKKTAKAEWHGACPHCGGKDRFWISPNNGNVAVHCRQCGDFAAIKDALRSRGLMPSQVERLPSPVERKIDLANDFPIIDDTLHPYLQAKGVAGV
jgi:hypothetical protein